MDDTVSTVKSISPLMEFGFRALGYWPGSRFAILNRLALGSSTIIFVVLQSIYVIDHFQSIELAVLMDCLTKTLTYILIFLKLSLFWSKGRVFRDVCATMYEDWKESTISKWNMYAMASTAEFSHRCAQYIVGLYTTSLVLYDCCIVLSQERTNNRRLLLTMSLPFDGMKSPVYELLLLVQFCHQTLAVVMESLTNMLLISLVLHATSQIDIILHDLEEISLKQDDSITRAINNIVWKHQKVIAFTESVENLFSYIAFVQIIMNIPITCFLGFVMVISLNTDSRFVTIVQALPYYASLNLGAFILCYAGEHLCSKSKSIGDAAYEFAWYNLEPRVSRVLLLVILRSQKRLTITVGKFMDLSLECFATILKLSGSYISVLYAMC